MSATLTEEKCVGTNAYLTKQDVDRNGNTAVDDIKNKKNGGERNV